MLRSFSFGLIYGVNELPENVINLFSELLQHPEINIEHTSEIVEAGLKGNIGENFSLIAYEKGIKKKEALAKISKAKKKKNIDTSLDTEQDNSVTSYFDISMTQLDMQVVKTTDLLDEYEKLLNEDELEYAIKEIKGLQKDIFIKEQIDVMQGLKDALEGVPVAIRTMKELCEKYERVNELVEIILSSKIPLESYLVCFGDV